MPEAPYPENEAERLAVLRALEILDTPGEDAFDRLTALARQVFDVPIALVSLVDAKRQWFKAKAGLDASETPRSQAFCAYAILADDILEISDAAEDPRTADNPLVLGPPHIRFYAGAPLTHPEGYRLGTFCIIDEKPRRLTEAQAEELRSLAGICVELLLYRQAGVDLNQERARAEKSERRLREAIEALPEAFTLFDQEDRLAILNEATLKLYARSADWVATGMTFEEIMRRGVAEGQYPAALQHPDGPEGWVKARTYQHQNPSGAIETQLGGGRWARVHDSVTKSGEIVGFRVDITAQKRVSELLRRLQEISSNEELSFDAKRQGLASLGREILGMDIGVVCGGAGDRLRILATSGVESREDLRAVLERGREIEDGDGLIGRLQRHGGMMAVSDTMASPTRGSTLVADVPVRSFIGGLVVIDGDLQGAVVFANLETAVELTPSDRDLMGIIVDWSSMEVRRRRALRALHAAKEEAEQASRAKSRFLAMMSHELRTPMNGVLGMLDLTLRTELDSEQRNMLEIAKLSAENLLVILNDILDFSKLEAGRLDIEIVPFALQDLLMGVTKLLGPGCMARGLRLHTLIDTRMAMHRHSDPTRLRQVLMNLLGNAIKFTEAGSVAVEITPSNETGDRVLFRVSDTGIGIPEDRRAALFQEFSQLETSVARRYGGTGLGLAICHRLVELMGGRIWIEPQGSVGTTFAFEIPMLDASGVADVSELTPFDPADLDLVRGRHVLIVDPDPVGREMISRQMEIWGARPMAAEGEAAAVAALDDPEAPRFDCCLIRDPDRRVPGKTAGAMQDGDRMLPVRLRATRGGKGTRFVLYGSRHRSEVEAAIREAVDYVTYEPIDPVTLTRMIGSGRGLRMASSTDEASADAATARLEPVPGPALGAVAPVAVKERDAPSDQGLNILVAEDNLVNQTLLERALLQYGHRVTVVDNGLKALAACRSETFDVVLMDIEMPEMDGIEATRWIRERLEDDTPTMVAMTAHALEGSQEWLLASGFNDYMSKPLSFQKLEALLSSIERRSGSPEPGPSQPAAATLEEAETVGEQPAPALPGVEENVVLLDHGRIDELLEVLDAPVLAAMAEQFLAGMDEYVDGLRQGLAGGTIDIDQTVRSAHALKGLALNFGAPGLSELAAALETDARERASTVTADRLPPIEARAAETREAIRARFALD